jgi:hypothetical protein
MIPKKRLSGLPGCHQKNNEPSDYERHYTAIEEFGAI